MKKKKKKKTISGDEIWPSEKWFEIVQTDLQENIMVSLKQLNFGIHFEKKKNVFLRYGGALQNLTLKLPVTINKFFQPTEMTSHDFFQRWKQLSQ